MSDLPDKSVYNFYDTSSGLTLIAYEEAVATLPDDSEAVKITSGCTGLTVAFHRVVGGREDCVDVNNHASGIRMHADTWEVRGEYLATIKGGSWDITLTSGPRGVSGKPASGVHVDIGNFSSQGNGRTGRVFLNLETDNGAPIVARLCNGTKVINLHPTQVVIVDDRWNNVFPYTYVPFRWLQLKILNFFK